MRALGIGMIIVAIGMVLIVGGARVNFHWTHDPPSNWEVDEMEDQMKFATSLELAGDIIVLIGVVIFIFEFFIHEHEVRAPTVARAARFCTKCGQAVAPDVKFCSHCGNALPD